MIMSLNEQILPPIYMRSGKECYLDPIREKLIYITPEETVRQRIVSYLMNTLSVAREMISIEDNLSHYGIKSKRRADIVVHRYNVERDTKEPIAVIECKAPGILLGEKAVNQAFDYADCLLCDYVMVTDGEIAFCFRYNEISNQYVEIEGFPKYEELLEGKYIYLKEEKLPERIKFKKLSKGIEGYRDFDIGINTPDIKAIPVLNFWEGLLDIQHKLPCRQYKIFNLIEDYGVRLLSYGNASGGVFAGPYRSFLVEVNGSTEFVSIGVSTYVSNAKPDIQKTSINIAIDNEKVTHHALQLVIDDNMIVIGDECYFYHHGRIGISNLGSGKISELRRLVIEKYPQIINEDKFYLGKLINNQLWHLDDLEVVSFVENLISYALLRDEYREVFVNNRK